MGVYHKTASETETIQFLIEKPKAREGITSVMLTSGEGFVAKNLSVYGRRVVL